MTESRWVEKTWWNDRLQVQLFGTRDELGRAAAAEVSAAMKEILATRGSLRMVFAAAPSQNEFLHVLAADTEINWSKVTVFHMDEYIGLDPDAPQRFGTFLDTRLFSRVKPGAVHLIDGSADPEKECERYTSLLQEAPIDIVCLGIGENGHLAFNDPPVADFEDPKTVKVVQLDDMCREQQVRDGCFERFEEVPEYAMTMTIPALLAASKLFCIVPGPSKRNAVTQTLTGPVSTSCPASILRQHPSCILYVDRDSYDD